MKRLLLLLIPLLIVNAQNYVLKRDVISSGGTPMAAGNYVLNGTVSQTTIGRDSSISYKAIIGFWWPFDFWPPQTPNITIVQKSGNNARIIWNKVLSDTLGNPEVIDYYVVYRSTTPNYVPGLSDSIGYASSDTTYIDVNAIPAGQSYYYLVKAVDYGCNRSGVSNMGFKFNKFLNENPSTTDMNWVSLPYLKTYAVVSDITNEMSPSGSSIVQLTNLKPEQYYENWFYVEGIGWLGTDFAIQTGKGYEFVVAKDTTTVITGAHDPNFRVPLVENPSATDLNWVSIPYNAVYAQVSNITDEYSPSGNPLIQVTRLRDDQYYENWFYIEGIGWLGTDFAIERGYAYEYVVNADTSWKPTVYTNQSFVYSDAGVVQQLKKNSYREPVWELKVDERDISNEDALDRKLLKKGGENRRTPHLVVATFDIGQEETDISAVTFTAYLVNHPQKALFEGSVGCGSVVKENKAIIWAEFGNLPYIWQSDEEAMIICEAKTNAGYWFGVRRFKLEAGKNPQVIEKIDRETIPELQVMNQDEKVRLRWQAVNNEAIIGYSIYQGNQRVNDKIITENEIAVIAKGEYELCPVFIGGYETYLPKCGIMADQEHNIMPSTYAFSTLGPNPFKENIRFSYALPTNAQVSLMVYDVTGRLVKKVVNQHQKFGYHSISWDGKDELSRRVSAGIYFVCFSAGDYQQREKIILVR
ncbi:MAG: T9SS type A sorting domain-containing protein [candidate division WOR-3 bacterium]